MNLKPLMELKPCFLSYQTYFVSLLMLVWGSISEAFIGRKDGPYEDSL